MNNAPAVYVPTQPEGNGLTLPTLLSLLAHGLVIGILIYTYQNTEVETVGSLETVMVSPEQLAEMPIVPRLPVLCKLIVVRAAHSVICQRTRLTVALAFKTPTNQTLSACLFLHALTILPVARC